LFDIANTSEKHQIVSLILLNLQLDSEKLIFNLKEPFDKLVNLSKGSYGWGSEQCIEHILYITNWFFENQNCTVFEPTSNSEILGLKQGHEYDYKL
jgi:hypothetical protein